MVSSKVFTNDVSLNEECAKYNTDRHSLCIQRRPPSPRSGSPFLEFFSQQQTREKASIPAMTTIRDPSRLQIGALTSLRNIGIR